MGDGYSAKQGVLENPEIFKHKVHNYKIVPATTKYTLLTDHYYNFIKAKKKKI